jgi:hypothetical protein
VGSPVAVAVAVAVVEAEVLALWAEIGLVPERVSAQLARAELAAAVVGLSSLVAEPSGLAQAIAGEGVRPEGVARLPQRRVRAVPGLVHWLQAGLALAFGRLALALEGLR